MDSPQPSQIPVRVNSIRFTISDDLRSEAEAVKANLVEQIDRANRKRESLSKEQGDLVILRDQLASESVVTSGAAPLTHDQAVQIAATRIRIDSINARLDEIGEMTQQRTAFDLVHASGVLRELATLWIDQTLKAVDAALRPFEPRAFVREQSLKHLASLAILQRIQNGTITIYNDAGTARRIIDIIDRFLEGRPYLGDDWNPETQEEQAEEANQEA